MSGKTFLSNSFIGPSTMIRKKVHKGKLQQWLASPFLCLELIKENSRLRRQLHLRNERTKKSTSSIDKFEEISFSIGHGHSDAISLIMKYHIT